jgi:hypothetical protein
VAVPLTVVIAVREGLDEIEPVLAQLVPQLRETGAEAVVVGRASGPAPAGVRVVTVDDDNIYRLRLLGLQAARGEVAAVGEDHAVPRPGWCAAVIRAHAEQPEAPAIAGCLVNATDRTVSGRGNFLAFAAPYAPPMPALPALRPPPISALSFKRAALSGVGEIGEIEADLIPRLFAEGRMGSDDRIVLDHYQDHGSLWAVRNSFHSARSSYGYAAAGDDRAQRLATARWSLANWPRRLFREARESDGAAARRDLALVACVATAAGVGGAMGALAGPGRSPERVA